jgi:putative membrane protein
MRRGKPISRTDFLARERTSLANERTFLAYLRTALSLLILGVALIHFSPDPDITLFGVFASAAGIIALAFGAWRFMKKHTRIQTH